MNSETTPNAISSPESPVGRMRLHSLEYQTCLEFGQEAAHANPFRAPAKDGDTKTSGTFGRHSQTSSASANLQSSLENRLRQNLDVNGSPEYSLTWKRWDMPSRVPICALRASARRTSGKGFTGLDGWATPTENKLTEQSRDNRCLARDCHVAGWQTPKAVTGEYQNGPNGKVFLNLEGEAKLAGWPTPNVDDANNATRDSGQFQSLTRAAGWATPTVQDSANNAGQSQFSRNSLPLNCEATLVVSGTEANGTTAATGSNGAFRLNPRFSLWLMGYPDAWASCAEQAMQSCRSVRRSSSKQH